MWSVQLVALVVVVLLGFGGSQSTFCHCNKRPELPDKEERFILAHGFNPWLLGPVALGLWCTVCHGGKWCGDAEYSSVSHINV
jgi:hypothetical protein